MNALTKDFVFTPTVNYAVGTAPYSIVATDLDGDSDNAMAVVNYVSNSVSILLSIRIPRQNRRLEFGIFSGRSPIHIPKLHGHPWRILLGKWLRI